jgi:hypothetical protein
MYSFQNATNEMKAWLPNDFLVNLLSSSASSVRLNRLLDCVFVPGA